LFLIKEQSYNIISNNNPPETPNQVTGPSEGETGIIYVYLSNTTDPDGDDIYFLFDWGDGTNSSWIGTFQSGENVTHMGRFALVAFFNSLQLSTEEIIELFSKAPDFDVEKTRYQIEHILGKTGATSYKPPGCDKLKTYGICPSEEIDEICKKTHHPTSYYRHKWKLNKNNKK